MSEAVCAVIYADGCDSQATEVVPALRAQTRAPSIVLTDVVLDVRSPGVGSFTAGKRESSPAAGLRAAQSHRCRWIWLLDGCAVPEPGALEALLAVGEAPGAPPPLLLASKVIDLDGHLHPDSAPRHEVLEKELSIDAAQRHLVQLRAAAPGSLLVAASAAVRFGPPRSDLPAGLDIYEWSARMLRSREDTGYLVPASLAVRASPPEPASLGRWLARVRIVSSSAWTLSEKLWEAFLLTLAAAAALRRGVGQGWVGVGAPGFSPSRSPRQMIGTTRGEKRLNRR